MVLASSSRMAFQFMEAGFDATRHSSPYANLRTAKKGTELRSFA